MAPAQRAITSLGRSELVIDRSRFVGRALAAGDADAAIHALAQVRGAEPGASHHVFAWRAGDGHERMSDDGEPQGTGGQPLLECLRRHAVDYGLLVVTRYYGGRKLGRPGLYRAYLAAGQQALADCRVSQLVHGTVYRIEAEHGVLHRVRRALEENDAVVDEESFAQRVTVRFWLPDATALERLAQGEPLMRRAQAVGERVEMRQAAR